MYQYFVDLAARNPDLLWIVIVTFFVSLVVWLYIKVFVFGLIMKDKPAIAFLTKWAERIAKVENSPFWFIPVGAPIALFGLIIFVQALNINWPTMSIALICLALGAVWIRGMIISSRRKRRNLIEASSKKPIKPSGPKVGS